MTLFVSISPIVVSYQYDNISNTYLSSYNVGMILFETLVSHWGPDPVFLTLCRSLYVSRLRFTARDCQTVVLLCFSSYISDHWLYTHYREQPFLLCSLSIYVCFSKGQNMYIIDVIKASQLDAFCHRP